MTDKTYKYSEIFLSPQGEGIGVTGDLCVWIRWFLCNLQCNGFGQTNPADPSTYDELPYQTFDVSKIKRIEDLPVWEKGCDSSYSWSKKYKHLCPAHTAKEIAQLIIDEMKNEYNPEGLFVHPHSGQNITLAITGGEPMFSQPATIDLLNAFDELGNYPRTVVVETNGTRPLTDDMILAIEKRIMSDRSPFKWTWSVSPKLLNTSGEQRKKAIKPEVVKQYQDTSPFGYLKFVVNGTKESWDELEEVIQLFREAGVVWPVSIMPVGATKEDQEKPEVAEIAREAAARGYHLSARVHSYVFGNVIGV